KVELCQRQRLACKRLLPGELTTERSYHQGHGDQDHEGGPPQNALLLTSPICGRKRRAQVKVAMGDSTGNAPVSRRTLRDNRRNRSDGTLPRIQTNCVSLCNLGGRLVRVAIDGPDCRRLQAVGRSL